MNKLFYALLLAVLFATPAHAMHIMEGYMPLNWCAVWYVLSLPFVVWSFIYIRKRVAQDPKAKLTLALSGAFVFILSALKLPSVNGSSSHLTGTTLGTVLVGPQAIPLVSVIVLLFQTLLLAHGGLSTLGANVFSLGIVGPFVAYGVYKGIKKIGLSDSVGIVLATFIGSMSTYVTTSFQLALFLPESATGIFGAAMKFLGIFAVTQVPLAIVESVITLFVYRILVRQGVSTYFTSKAVSHEKA